MNEIERMDFERALLVVAVSAISAQSYEAMSYLHSVLDMVSISIDAEKALDVGFGDEDDLGHVKILAGMLARRFPQHAK